MEVLAVSEDYKDLVGDKQIEMNPMMVQTVQKPSFTAIVPMIALDEAAFSLKEWISNFRSL